jgi:hypothetical protein
MGDYYWEEGGLEWAGAGWVEGGAPARTIAANGPPADDRGRHKLSFKGTSTRARHGYNIRSAALSRPGPVPACGRINTWAPNSGSGISPTPRPRSVTTSKAVRLRQAADDIHADRQLRRHGPTGGLMRLTRDIGDVRKAVSARRAMMDPLRRLRRALLATCVTAGYHARPCRPHRLCREVDAPNPTSRGRGTFVLVSCSSRLQRLRHPGSPRSHPITYL